MNEDIAQQIFAAANMHRDLWRAGYDAGFEEGRRQAVQAMQSLAEISAKIDALAEPISRGTS